VSDDSRSGGPGAVGQPARGGARDYQGRVRLEYAPERDGEPDPGEVVWAWVPFEEDHSIGKDRPLIVIGRTLASDGVVMAGDLAAFMLSSKDRSDDPRWVAIGDGGWDADVRDSWVRVDRLFAVTIEEGSSLNRSAYDRVVEAARESAGG
jgi:PemK-like, MazF-like toxin of type II toxin-antitoxin system